MINKRLTIKINKYYNRLDLFNMFAFKRNI